MSERYQGGFITATVVNPDGNVQDSSTATGVWTLVEQFTFHKAGLWPSINARGIFFGGNYPGASNVIDFITINSTGNVTDFGDLTTPTSRHWANSSLTRGIMGGGLHPAPASVPDVIEYITILSTGNATDFGNMQAGGYWCAGGTHNKTRSVFVEGHAGPGNNNPSNVISFVTTATTGNASDFGDISDSGSHATGCCSPVRGVYFHGAKGNPDSAPTDTIDYVTIASAGNATDFGNARTSQDWQGSASCSSSVRGISKNAGEMNYVTIASTGNTTDFGDPTVGNLYGSALSNNLRGIFTGGQDSNVIEFVTIATTGNAADFGDLSANRGGGFGSCANGDGGHQ